jgi:lysophospholipase L1-like esterase
MRPIYVFGDSIGQGIYVQESSGRYRRSMKSCIQQLSEGGLPIESRALMGCTVEKGLEFFRGTETQSGGICVIEFGGNDCDLDWQAVSDHPTVFHDGKVPLKRFGEALRIFVKEARGRYLTPLLVTPPPILSQRYYHWVSRGKNAEHILQYLGDVEHISRWQERYANVIRGVSGEAGCPLLDLRARWLEERNLPALMSRDGIHPNEAGYTAMARYVWEETKNWELPVPG